MNRQRKGLTLVEIIVAMLVFSTGALGLAAASAAITRQMTGSMMRSRAASIARNRDEIARSRTCAATTSGEETTFGVRSSWQMSPGSAAVLIQDLERKTPLGIHTDRFMSGMPCD